MMNIYMDSEYIENINKTKYSTICGVVKDGYGANKFDLRNSYDAIRDYLYSLDLSKCLFMAYNITTAEIPVLCQIMPVKWVMKTTWIDLWVEFKMFALTHPKYFTSKTGLESCIKTLGIEAEYEADKKGTRDLILYNVNERKVAEDSRKTRIETGDFNYSETEFEQIMHYCEQDVLILPKIVKRLNEISKPYPIKLDHRIRRGEHCKLAGIAYSQHNGYPMDVERVQKVFGNIPKIKESLQLNCNKQVGHEIYQAKMKGPRKCKVLSHYQFNMKNFGDYLKSKGLYDSWEKTETGLKLDEEYLDEKLAAYREILEPVYAARNTIKQLNSTNLAHLLTPGGYIKSVAWPYNQKTSRTSPKPKLGFVLNLTPWLRMLIRPKPGRAFVSIDFKSQEVLIAACLSMDDSMLEDYLTDIYIGQAVKTGFAPAGATKDTHKSLRNSFKPIVLGRSFGMAADSLSIHFFNLYKSQGIDKNLKECLYQAEKYIKAHEKAYHKYYEFLRGHFKKCKSQQYYKNLDNWFYFIDRQTRETQLKNTPCQSNGCAMTNDAEDECIRRGIWVTSLHDALNFECAEEDVIPLAKIVSKIMVRSSAKILGYDHMSTETKIFTHDCPYYDSRGEQIYNFVMDQLGETPWKFKKPLEILNIHENPSY